MQSWDILKPYKPVLAASAVAYGPLLEADWSCSNSTSSSPARINSWAADTLAAAPTASPSLPQAAEHQPGIDENPTCCCRIEQMRHGKNCAKSLRVFILPLLQKFRVQMKQWDIDQHSPLLMWAVSSRSEQTWLSCMQAQPHP